MRIAERLVDALLEDDGEKKGMPDWLKKKISGKSDDDDGDDDGEKPEKSEKSSGGGESSGSSVAACGPAPGKVKNSI